MVTLYSLNLMQNAEACFWSWLTDYLTQGHFDGELIYRSGVPPSIQVIRC